MCQWGGGDDEDKAPEVNILPGAAFTMLKQEAEGQIAPTRVWKEKTVH